MLLVTMMKSSEFRTFWQSFLINVVRICLTLIIGVAALGVIAAAGIGLAYLLFFLAPDWVVYVLIGAVFIGYIAWEETKW
jgi:hypothetical protein